MISRIGMIGMTMLAAGGLLWLLLPSAAHAAQDIEVSIVFGPEVVSPTNSLQVGDVFTAQVRSASATDQTIGTYGFYMTYSQTVVSVTSIAKLYPINGFEACPTPLGFDNDTGQIVGECSDIGGGGTNSDGLQLLEITFEVLQTNSRFDLHFEQCDGVGDSDCFQLLSSGVNQIATYNDASDTPTAVQLLDGQAALEIDRVILGGLLFTAVLGLITTVGFRRYKISRG